MSIAVIGLGSVGSRVLGEMRGRLGTKEIVVGFDTDADAVRRMSGFGAVGRLEGPFDTYVICVRTTEQVFDVLGSIDYGRKPLVCVESTIEPGSETKMAETVLGRGGDFVLCPHRFCEGDPEHGIFNQKRLIAGADKGSFRRGLHFYSKFIDRKLIVETDIRHAALSKVVENSMRFLEIAAAEELMTLCIKSGYDFGELRRCANTKWNIDIKEARKGIGGTCLPKDVGIFNDLFEGNVLFSAAYRIDSSYKKLVKSHGKVPSKKS